MAEEYLYTGSVEEQELFKVILRFAKNDALAEPWVDENVDTKHEGTLYRRYPVVSYGAGDRILKRDTMCGQVVKEDDGTWTANGIRLRPQMGIESRDKAMSIVDEHLRNAGWLLP